MYISMYTYIYIYMYVYIYTLEDYPPPPHSCRHAALNHVRCVLSFYRPTCQ